jgi:hypothetical protein
MYEVEKILREMNDHQKSFIEKPHIATNGLPVCPFAKKARLEDQILYVIEPFSLSRIVEKVAEWRQSGYRVLTFVDPYKEMPLEQYMDIYREVVSALPGDLEALDSHPLHPFEMNGLHTRRDPYPNIQITHLWDLEESRRKLKNSRYYL